MGLIKNILEGCKDMYDRATSTFHRDEFINTFDSKLLGLFGKQYLVGFNQKKPQKSLRTRPLVQIRDDNNKLVLDTYILPADNSSLSSNARYVPVDVRSNSTNIRGAAIIPPAQEEQKRLLDIASTQFTEYHGNRNNIGIRQATKKGLENVLDTISQKKPQGDYLCFDESLFSSPRVQFLSEDYTPTMAKVEQAIKETTTYLKKVRDNTLPDIDTGILTLENRLATDSTTPKLDISDSRIQNTATEMIGIYLGKGMMKRYHRESLRSLQSLITKYNLISKEFDPDQEIAQALQGWDIKEALRCISQGKNSIQEKISELDNKYRGIIEKINSSGKLGQLGIISRTPIPNSSPHDPTKATATHRNIDTIESMVKEYFIRSVRVIESKKFEKGSKTLYQRITEELSSPIRLRQESLDQDIISRLLERQPDYKDILTSGRKVEYCSYALALSWLAPSEQAIFKNLSSYPDTQDLHPQVKGYLKKIASSAYKSFMESYNGMTLPGRQEKIKDRDDIDKKMTQICNYLINNPSLEREQSRQCIESARRYAGAYKILGILDQIETPAITFKQATFPS